MTLRIVKAETKCAIYSSRLVSRRMGNLGEGRERIAKFYGIFDVLLSVLFPSIVH